jgi:ABC-type nickel/cobalt efflux system permease component RcnA
MSDKEKVLGVGYDSIGDWDTAQEHYERSIFHAIRMKDKEYKLERMSGTLIIQCALYLRMRNLFGAKVRVKRAYKLISEAHNSEHPRVKDVAYTLSAIIDVTKDQFLEEEGKSEEGKERERIYQNWLSD